LLRGEEQRREVRHFFGMERKACKEKREKKEVS
jgi:hypothetical protein